jgi:Flp pilus assembly protein CpaB
MDRARWLLIRARARRALAVRRRPLAALVAAAAVAAAVEAARPSDAPTEQAVVVVSGLPAGHLLRPGDVRTREVPTDLLPHGALDIDDLPVGRPVAAPLRAGQLLTDLSVVSPTALQSHPPGTVLATVRITDPAAIETVAVGDRVSVIGADLRSAGAASLVARRVLVVALPGEESDGGLGQGRPVVLAVDEATALSLADAAVGSALSLVVTG